MILSDRTLTKLLDEGVVSISPLEDYQIQPSSIDLTLGEEYLYIDNNQHVISMNEPINYIQRNSNKNVILPHEFLLATTKETIKLPDNISAFVEGRSSIGRMGLFIQNAGWIDAGFEGKITLELFNATNRPIALHSGRRLCQIVLAKMDDHAEFPYTGKYQGQNTVVGSGINYDDEVVGDEE